MKSHIKGKLREAWEELKKAAANTEEKSVFQPDTEHWLGKQTGTGDHGSYEPHRGRMLFSDFICTEKPPFEMQKFHRIRINRESGTADEGALITVETPFESGAETCWKGEITWTSQSREKAEEVRNQVLTGLRWITAMGAEKTVGFGRLLRVVCEDFSARENEKFHPPPAPPSGEGSFQDSLPRRGRAGEGESRMGLSISLKEALTVGGVKMKDNYMESGSIFSGAIIKGSLAECIRRRLNLGRDAPIGECEEMEDAGLGLLGRWFEKLSFSHAFPSLQKDRRPVCPPLSLLKAGGKIHDAALLENWKLFSDGNGKKLAPAFAADWKDEGDVKRKYGWAEPKILALTRTAIETFSRRAKEEQLYTFEYICPEDEKKRQISWLAEIRLPEDCPEKEKLSAQLEYVLQGRFDHMGKRQGRIRAETVSCTPFIPSGELLREGLTIICLQSDALMLNPNDIPNDIRNGDHAELLKKYGEYWKDISGGAFRLLRFYARQKLAGGYLGLRFPTQEKYSPFLLTQAGSVFVLTDENTGDAEKKCREWLQYGLPETKWMIQAYGKEGKTDWNQCPFIRENGFGEIAVNLPCHWETRRKS
jgi:hypothetical protein